MGYKLIFHFPQKTRSLLHKQLAQFPLNWLLYHIFLLYILIIHLFELLFLSLLRYN